MIKSKLLILLCCIVLLLCSCSVAKKGSSATTQHIPASTIPQINDFNTSKQSTSSTTANNLISTSTNITQETTKTTTGISTPIATSTNKQPNTQKPTGVALIVYGEDITSKCPIAIDLSQKNPGLPLTLILDDLNCLWRWENENIFSFDLGGERFVLDITKTNFGWLKPAGASSAIRMVVNDEIIIDALSLFWLLRDYGHYLYIDTDLNVVGISDIEGPFSR